jgi:hypothetical protein
MLAARGNRLRIIAGRFEQDSGNSVKQSMNACLPPKNEPALPEQS